MVRTYKVEAVILKRVNYGEADKIITAFTKQNGRITFIAKGVRKIHSRKSPSLEVFNRTVLFLAKGKNLDLVTQAQVLDCFSSWRKNLNRVGVAYYLCELVDKLTAAEQPNPAVYDLLVNNLDKLSRVNLILLVREFEENLLNLLGFGIPATVEEQTGSLYRYLETITERKINSPGIIRSLAKQPLID